MKNLFTFVLIVISMNMNLFAQSGVTTVVNVGFKWKDGLRGKISKHIYENPQLADGGHTINGSSIVFYIYTVTGSEQIKFRPGESSIGNYNWTFPSVGKRVWSYTPFTWLKDGYYEKKDDVYYVDCGNHGDLQRPIVAKTIIVDKTDNKLIEENKRLIEENRILKLEIETLKRQLDELFMCIEVKDQVIDLYIAYYIQKSIKFKQARAFLEQLYYQNQSCFRDFPLLKRRNDGLKYAIGGAIGFAGGFLLGKNTVKVPSINQNQTGGYNQGGSPNNGGNGSYNTGSSIYRNRGYRSSASGFSRN